REARALREGHLQLRLRHLWPLPVEPADDEHQSLLVPGAPPGSRLLRSVLQGRRLHADAERALRALARQRKAVGVAATARARRREALAVHVRCGLEELSHAPLPAGGLNYTVARAFQPARCVVAHA